MPSRVGSLRGRRAPKWALDTHEQMPLACFAHTPSEAGPSMSATRSQTRAWRPGRGTSRPLLITMCGGSAGSASSAAAKNACCALTDKLS